MESDYDIHAETPKKMKLQEYLNSNYLTNENVITLQKYEQFITHFVNRDGLFVHLKLSEDFLEYDNIIDFFKNIKNTIVFICSPDIDFPPPKKPYSYDKYAIFSKVPSNYLDISYCDKIHNDLIPIIENNHLKIMTHSVSIYSPNISTIPIGIFPKFNHYYLHL
jgi:hypothetical protein